MDSHERSYPQCEIPHFLGAHKYINENLLIVLNISKIKIVIRYLSQMIYRLTK